MSVVAVPIAVVVLVQKSLSVSETVPAESAGWANGATGKDSEATSVLAAEYFCLEPVVGWAANTRTLRIPLCTHKHMTVLALVCSSPVGIEKWWTLAKRHGAKHYIHMTHEAFSRRWKCNDFYNSTSWDSWWCSLRGWTHERFKRTHREIRWIFNNPLEILYGAHILN